MPEKITIAGLEVEVSTAEEIQRSGCPVVALRRTDARLTVPGTKSGFPCHLCGADCILAPSGQEIIAAGKNPVQCINCTRELSKEKEAS